MTDPHSVHVTPATEPTPHSPVVKAEQATILIFGASGDLTARKLIPALYQLWSEGYLSRTSSIVGVARREKTDEAFRNEMEEAVAQSVKGNSFSSETWNGFAERLFYHQLDITDVEGYGHLNERLHNLESNDEGDAPAKRIVYLALAPSLFQPAVESLSVSGMIPDAESQDMLRVVVEKPFGRDLKSAQELTQSLSRLLREDQIYRIDHYLGKETVQNILLFRFGNAIFEPLLNRNHVDHVQITVAESVGMERGRGGYYDKSGCNARCSAKPCIAIVITGCDGTPAYFTGKHIRDEKLKVLQALRPGQKDDFTQWAIPGQYTNGVMDSNQVPGYREEERIPPGSNRETYVAMKVLIDNWEMGRGSFLSSYGKATSSTNDRGGDSV